MVNGYWYFPSNRYKSEAHKKHVYDIDFDETKGYDMDEYSDATSLIYVDGLVERGRGRKIRTHLSKGYRQFIFDRANHKCSRCGKTEDLQIHHKDENAANDSTSNLEVYCYSCHKLAHKAKRKVRTGYL